MAIEGYLRQDEGAMLCFLAHESPPGAVLEIGSFRGKSTVFLARGIASDHTLTAVDPQHNQKDLPPSGESDPAGDEADTGRMEAYLATLRSWGLEDRVESVRRYSYNLRPDWTRPLSMLWVDGHHAYEGVQRDIEDWVDLVVPGGYVAFHDTNPGHVKTYGWGVRRAISESALLKQEFEVVLELRNAWFFRRRG